MEKKSPPSLYHLSRSAVVNGTLVGTLLKIHSCEKKSEKSWFNFFKSARKIYLTETYTKLKEYLDSFDPYLKNLIYIFLKRNDLQRKPLAIERKFGFAHDWESTRKYLGIYDLDGLGRLFDDRKKKGFLDNFRKNEDHFPFVHLDLEYIARHLGIPINLDNSDETEIVFSLWLLFVNQNRSLEQPVIPDQNTKHDHFENHLWTYLCQAKEPPIFEDFKITAYTLIIPKDVDAVLEKIGKYIKRLEIAGYPRLKTGPEAVRSNLLELAYKYMPNLEELVVTDEIAYTCAEEKIGKEEYLIKILEENKNLKKLVLYLQDHCPITIMKDLLAQMNKVSALEQLHFCRGDYFVFGCIDEIQKYTKVFPNLKLHGAIFDTRRFSLRPVDEVSTKIESADLTVEPEDLRFILEKLENLKQAYILLASPSKQKCLEKLELSNMVELLVDGVQDLQALYWIFSGAPNLKIFKAICLKNLKMKNLWTRTVNFTEEDFLTVLTENQDSMSNLEVFEVQCIRDYIDEEKKEILVSSTEDENWMNPPRRRQVGDLLFKRNYQKSLKYFHSDIFQLSKDLRNDKNFWMQADFKYIKGKYVKNC